MGVEAQRILKSGTEGCRWCHDSIGFWPLWPYQCFSDDGPSVPIGGTNRLRSPRLSPDSRAGECRFFLAVAECALTPSPPTRRAVMSASNRRPVVAVFGSSTLREDEPAYAEVRVLGAELATRAASR